MEDTKKPLRIVAVYKTFRGEEFALDSIASIYNHVSKILFVHSDKSWNGESGNTVRDVVMGAPDPDNKIVHINKNGNQNDQYNAAIEWLFENEEKYDYLMLIDTDEVWDETAWQRALPELKKNLMENIPAPSLRCEIYDYIKSPFFRVDPPAPLKPCVFVIKEAVLLNSLDVRGMHIGPSKILYSVFFHHFCSVRKSLSAVWNKHETSCNVESEPIYNRDNWITRVWNQLPRAINCLPLMNYAHNWKAVKVIQLFELPPAVHENPIVKAWQKYPTTVCNTFFADQRDLLLKNGLPGDFGPGHPEWNIPSKRNRYNKALAMAVQNG